ncbi:hypothetical protein ACLVR9_05135 [Streptococcus pneumoniae]
MNPEIIDNVNNPSHYHGFYQDDTKLGKIRDAIISQMNNGHVVVLGEDRGILLNPKVIKSVQFKVVEDNQI